jgi:hypothetical protein
MHTMLFNSQTERMRSLSTPWSLFRLIRACIGPWLLSVRNRNRIKHSLGVAVARPEPRGISLMADP